MESLLLTRNSDAAKAGTSRRLSLPNSLSQPRAHASGRQLHRRALQRSTMWRKVPSAACRRAWHIADARCRRWFGQRSFGRGPVVQTLADAQTPAGADGCSGDARRTLGRRPLVQTIVRATPAGASERPGMLRRLLVQTLVRAMGPQLPIGPSLADAEPNLAGEARGLSQIWSKWARIQPNSTAIGTNSDQIGPESAKPSSTGSGPPSRQTSAWFLKMCTIHADSAMKRHRKNMNHA